MTPLRLALSGIDLRWRLAAAAGVAALSVVIAGGLAAARLQAASIRPAPLRPGPSPAPPAQADLGPALALAPFGQAIGDETSGALTLKAVIQGPPGTAAALIAQHDGPARPYGLGDQVAADAWLEAVGVDHAMLRTATGLVRLAFPKARTTKDEAGPPAGSAPVPSQAPLAAEPGSAQGNGFKLGATPWPALQRAGLRPGDVVASVDGLPVGEMERGVVDAIASGKARIEVVRDGQALVLGAERH